MTKVVGALLAGFVLASVLSAAWLMGPNSETTRANPDFSIGVDTDASGNTATHLDSIETSRTVNCGDFFPIDIYVTDVANLTMWNVTLHYNPAMLGVYARDVQMFLTASPGSNVVDRSNGDSGFSGNYDLLAADTNYPTADDSGSGVLVRLNIGAKAPGTSELSLTPERFWPNMPSPAAFGGQVTVVGNCGTPVPTPTPEPTQTPTPSPTPTPTPTPTSTPTPTGTPGPSATPGSSPTPEPEPTVTPSPTPVPPPGTVYLAAGWNGSCYQGSNQQIDDAFANINGVQAVYRLNDQAFERWFPDRPELSNIAALSPFDPLLILADEAATWEVSPHTDLPHSTPLSSGWNSICYLGAAKDTEEAAAGIMGDFTVIYTLTPDRGWRRFVDGRPEVSNLERLETFTSVLILVTDSDGALWLFDQ
jgi:hypothetical protein